MRRKLFCAHRDCCFIPPFIHSFFPNRVQTKRQNAQNKQVAFYFAAIGAAVGFGNVWRFPALAASYGGGAFFIPYLMALFLIGIPLLILEVSLGQYYQTGDVGVFGSFHRRWRGVGVSSVSCAYMVVTYYSVLIAWVIRAFFDSFGSSDPWAEEGTTGGDAAGYFINSIIGAYCVRVLRVRVRVCIISIVIVVVVVVLLLCGCF